MEPPSNFQQFVFATYTESPVPQMRGNVLIEALPAIKDDVAWLDQLIGLPEFDISERDLEPHVRAYHVAQLKSAFIPSDRHLEFARRIDQLIRWGYAKRNPNSHLRMETLRETYERAQRSGKAEQIAFSETAPICSFSLVGASGMGKSTSIERVLAAYPQYIVHKELGLHQVVWLKVDCPQNGSVKDLGLNVLRAFDRVLGTKHAPSRSSHQTASGILAMCAHLANTYCLGVLVLDELQNVCVKRSGGREEVLNWGQQLVNELHLPVVLLGTYKAKSVIQLDMRHARRNAASGSATWRPMLNGPEFVQLVQTLWAWQWLRAPGELTDELVQTIHHETQGIAAFVVDMFMIAQLHAMQTGLETITSDLFTKVARTEFEPVQPILRALRSGDPKRLMKFEDATPYDIDELLQAHQVAVRRKASSAPAASSGTSQPRSMIADATRVLREYLNLEDAQVQRLIADALDGTEKTSSAIVSKAIQHFLAISGPQATAPMAP